MPRPKRVYAFNSGDTLGKIEFVCYLEDNRYWDSIGKFLCHCGKEFEHRLYEAGNGLLKSCGCGKHYNRLPPGESLYNAAVGKIINHIKKRGIELSVSREYLISLVKLPCAYCGETGGNVSKNKSTLTKEIRFNGIDRIDSSRGYIEGNCAPCCKRCNRAKSDMSVEEFVNHIIKIYQFLPQWYKK